MNLFFKQIESPIGKLTLVATHEALVALLWKNQKWSAMQGEKIEPADRKHPILDKAEKQLKEYFDGQREVFELPLKPAGTAFQQKVWKALCEIPFGSTQSYGGLAKAIGSPKASRAVGAANSKNPIGIIIPCHRVIGANGKLTGFAGGLDLKGKLLNLEGHSV